MMKRKARVLLIDDDKPLSDALSKVLEIRGFDVSTASNGKRALALIDRRSPDIIVLDMSMPVMSGIGFLKEISCELGVPKYPVIVFTARTNMGDFFDNVNVDAFLEKPCLPNRLIAEIEAVLEKKGVNLEDFHYECDRALKVLLADDDPEMSADLHRVFTVDGYKVLKVRQARDVIERAILTKPHIIVVKHIMRGMNGGKIASTLYDIPQSCDVPVVLYESDTGKESANSYAAKNPNVKEFVYSDNPKDILKGVRKVHAMMKTHRI